MSSLNLLLYQIFVMFLYLGVGYLLFRMGKITRKGSSDLASLLIWLVLPVVIIKSFCVEPTKERVQALGISFLLSMLLLILAMIVSRLCFSGQPIDNFAGAFSNAGFIGIPLVEAMLGEEAVFYIAPFILLLNLAQSTYGVSVMTGNSMQIDIKLLKNPFVVSTAIAIVVFFTNIGTIIPQPLMSAVSGISALNAPLAMIILGVYFAQTKIFTLFNDLRLYRVCLVRLIVIPVISLLVCAILPVSTEIALAIMIAVSAPTGANVAVYAQLEKLDYAYASKTVVLSTLFCAVSIPLILYVSGFVL